MSRGNKSYLEGGGAMGETITVDMVLVNITN